VVKESLAAIGANACAKLNTSDQVRIIGLKDVLDFDDCGMLGPCFRAGGD
jgi:hypothetical protein